MPELDINLPSTRQIQGSIKDKIEMSIKLLTGDVFTGRIVWQDPDCVFFTDANDRKTLIYRQAIAYIQYQ
ncbi:RNA-binding protein hfq [Chamaesiphon sp. GL140_3_metabinner_50]|uniref:Hfq-related RNA-binding protein n=1 Tax=Chamaesiphon sp. GL140_3_metabinner_50 TaxID=2970812 RepID=UPI0025E7DC5E|nr:RNA-binding protein hfq [Chamaesiphon sp. GL140_3_metabinner_50]